MSVISKASLVQIPSGYGEDKLYSEVPNTTNGDFTFTRASTGTRVNADGYIEEVPWNLNTYSEDFTNASYIKDSGITIASTNNLSPIGNNTATQIDVTNSGRIYKNVTSAQYRTSVYLKAGTFAYFKFANSQIDLNLGTINSPYSSSIEDVGNGWYRISVSFVATIRPFQVQAYPDNTYTPHTQSGNYFIWGSMLNYGSTTKPYIKTTDRLDVPRLDYSGGASCPTLLLEPQRTNEVTYSSDYSTGWAKSNTTTIANDAISPSGLEDASKIYPNSSGNYRHIRKLGLSPSSGLYTFSIFAKAGELEHLVLLDYDGGGIGVDFDLTNGVATDNATSPFDNVDMIDYGNGWYRCEATATDMYFYWILSDNGGLSVTANGTDGLYIWGAMAEQGSYPTSYIPTSGTSVTRVADHCELTNNATLPTDYPFALYFEADMNENSNWYISFLNNASQSQYAGIYSAGGTRFVAANRMQGPNNLCYSSYLSYGIHKVAAYFENETTIKLFVDGTLETTQTITSTAFNTNVNDLYLGRLRSYDTTRTSVKSAYIFNQALTDTELEELTTI